ncbi:MAG: FAD-binding oxidoreductase [Gammaproteobacteria bacterium]|nr:FAD-binding oxidoreductase [Gammaproteobacteria bacterium]
MELLSELESIVGRPQVLSGTDVTDRATHFWDASPLQALAVVRPGSTSEVSQILKLCHKLEQPIVTHGGVTGLAGGDSSSTSDVILSLDRMNSIEPADVTNRSITVDAGATLQSVQEAAEYHQLQFGLDLGARGSCTIGGNISTNAGGLSVLRYGMMREQVLGLEAVLADGTIVSSMNQMMKNNTGYDLKQLFIGSEGTLGVVTRAVLRLRPPTPSINTAMVAFNDFEQVQRFLGSASGSLNAQLNAFEIMWQPYYALNTDPAVEGSVKAILPAHYSLYAIIETRGGDVERDAALFQQTMEAALTEEMIIDAVIAQSEQDRMDIWAVRENVDTALQVHKPHFVYDISLPVKSMAGYLTAVEDALKTRWQTLGFYAYGHLADGNLHLVIGPTLNPSDKVGEAHSFCNTVVFEHLQPLGGSISAEHGIGLYKKAYLTYSRSEAEIELMRSLKRTLDPKLILNRDKIVSV